MAEGGWVRWSGLRSGVVRVACDFFLFSLQRKRWLCCEIRYWTVGVGWKIGLFVSKSCKCFFERALFLFLGKSCLSRFSCGFVSDLRIRVGCLLDVFIDR